VAAATLTASFHAKDAGANPDQGCPGHNRQLSSWVWERNSPRTSDKLQVDGLNQPGVRTVETRRGWPQSEYLVRSAIIGLMAITVGALFVWWSTVQTSAVPAAFLANVGTAVLTTGVIGTVYEGFLKRGLLDDVRRTTKVSQDLIDVGVVQVTTDANRLDLKDILEDSPEIDILPHAPMIWAAQNMSWVIKTAIDRSVVFRIYMPDPKIYSQVETTLQNSTEALDTVRERCASCAREMVVQWNLAKTSIRKDSRLEVIQYSGYPHTGFIVSRSAIVVIAPTAQGPSDDLQVVATVFHGARARDARRWAEQTIENLRDRATIDASDSQQQKPTVDDILPVDDEQIAAPDEPVVGVRPKGVNHG
jgi:hypothetical protein